MQPFVAAVLRLLVGVVRAWWSKVWLKLRSPRSTCTVTIAPGKVRGGVTSDASGVHYHYFKGIPYAVPPVGDLRFKAPVALECFQRPVLDCFTEGNKCLQYDQILKVLVGSEDGLYLNVHTPELPDEAGSPPRTTAPGMPVMVYIHGGGFMSGSGDSFLYDPVYFLPQRVVMVTFNYRLGPLGFLSFPEAGIEGNAGLHDQLVVLRWVRQNISAFGGNPGNVTLFGESAGAKAAYLHYLSPVSRQFFHRVICQSGVACSDFALQVKPSAKARKLAECLGYRGSSDSEAMEVLLKAPAKQLFKHQLETLDVSEQHQELKFPFRPVVERNLPGAIVTQHPLDALRSELEPPIPIITGCNSGEGMVALAEAKKNLSEYNFHPERLLPPMLQLPEGVYPTELGEKVKDFYFGDHPVDAQTLPELMNLLSDNEYLTATVTAATLLSRYQPRVAHFCYYFTFDGRYGNIKHLLNMSNLAGVCHGDDVFYMFHSALNASLPEDADEIVVRQHFVKLWTNFALHGNPTPADLEVTGEFPTWEPVKASSGETFRLECLQIDRTMKMIANPFEKRSAFWRDLFRTFGYGSRKLSI